MKPDSPFFEVSAARNMNGEPLKQSKIASGMEVYFILTFKPQEVRDYSFDLICSTEREKFIVPIRAVGMRPKLTLPDDIDFGSCPIKAPSQKKLTVQNFGTAVARFNMTSSNPEFTCPGQDIAIEPGASESIELHFTPTTVVPASGEIEIQFLKGVTCYISLQGVGKNADVSLSTPSLTLEPSYISLLSQKSLKIRNHSDAPISYNWKSFHSVEEEESERDRLLMEINRMEEMEHAALRQRIMEGFYAAAGMGSASAEYEQDDQVHYLEGDHGMLEGSDGGEGYGAIAVPFAAKADEAALIRKYRNLRKALEKDGMQFVDDIFEISPISGQVWAHSEVEVTVCFRPDTAALYSCLAYLDVSGRNDRLALQLTGQGIGPHAALSFDVLDIGDVYINDESFYEVSIKNKGDIPAQWSFMSSLTRFGNKFQFSPTEGHLQPNQSQTVNIRFESDVLGEFAEHFRFALQGNEDMLICQIKGHVIGPNFHFDCKSIDFGTVSFDYLHSTTVRMVNTSKIPMIYTLHIPQDGTYLKKEFNIEPSKGTLAPRESVEVLVEFIPGTVKEYDYSLAVDVLGVGEMLLSVPITATCIISTVKLEIPTREIDFGDCFIRYPYEQELRLTNMSDIVHTKFEILPQLKQTKSVATFETEPAIAVIEPSDSMNVKIRLVAQKLGPFKVPMTIAVAGSSEPPLQAVLAFNTVGPKVSVDCTELRWGSIECLKDCSRWLRITNEGLITASVKLFLKMARSCYRIDVRELVLEAQQSFDIEVIANLDDSVVTKDEVHIVVEEGDNIMVPLVAKGIGTTMYCKEEVSVMDLGVNLTNIYFEKQIVLENKGRRPQVLRWFNKTAKLENQARAAKVKKSGKEVLPGQRLPKHLAPVEPVLTVTPEEITLRSRTATTFTFRGICTTPKQVSEVFVLESKVGKERYFKEVVEAEVRVQVVNPLLQFSQSNVDFMYSWERGVEAALQKVPLVLTNTSAVPLSFVLKTEIPFNLSAWEQTLQPGQKCDLEVEFDPAYRDDQQSHVVEKALVIAYRGHPQKDSIPLRGEVIFPNLSFDVKDAIAFGCVLNDTSKVLKVRATNSCKIDVNYEWIFVETTGKSKEARRQASSGLPPSQVFDILPVRSLLRPGTSEDVEFSMFGSANARVNGTVICAVEGGPEYSFTISGEASTVGFELSHSLIDFGKVVFTEKGEQELEIINKGRVPFNFELCPATVEGEMVLSIVPPAGKVEAGKRAKVAVRVRPALPVPMKQDIVVRVAHFDPVTLPCYCQGIFPTAVVALPRYRKVGPLGEADVTSADWAAFTNMAVQNLLAPDTDILPPADLPVPASGSTSAPPVYETLALLPPLPPGAGGDDEDDDDDCGRSVGAVSMGGGMSKASTTKGLNHNVVEVEMQRVVLSQLLADKIAGLRPGSPRSEMGSRGASRATGRPGTTRSSMGGGRRDVEPSSPRFGLQAHIHRSLKVGDIVAARYLCDFGNVIIGQTRKKIFKITNASLVGQLNWVFDKKYLAGSGFSIEPEKVQKMAEAVTLEFTVKFFARHNQKVGQLTSILPLESAGSPTIHLVMSANVCMPELELSCEAVEFGRVLLGRSMKMWVRMHNPTPVTAVWSFKRSNNRDEQRFSFEPAAGSLRPGKKAFICVEFLPTEVHRYSVEVPIKIENNKKARSLHLSGECYGAPLKFEPSVLELGPVLPYATGDEHVVTVHNNSDVDVEFFSLDFDEQHKAEEAVLSQIGTYDEGGVLRTDVRGAGQPLPREVLEAHAQLQAEAEAEAGHSGAGEEGGESAASAVAAEGEEGAQGADAEQSDAAAAAAAAAAASTAAVSAAASTSPVLMSAALRSQPGPRDRKEHQDIVVFGPPLSGVTSHAQQMARRLQLPLRTVDQIVEEVAGTDHDPLGAVARAFCGQMSAAEQQARDEKEALLLQAAEQSKVEAAEAYKKEKKGKAKEIPDEVYATAEVQAHKDFVASFLPNADNLAKILTYRLSWEGDAGEGCVYDGINSAYAEPDVVLAAFGQALPDALLTHIHINRNDEGYAAWLASLYESKHRDLEALQTSLDSFRRLALKSRGGRGQTGKQCGHSCCYRGRPLPGRHYG